MTRAVILLLVLVLAGCGDKTDAAKSSVPCLRKLGLYADHGVPKELNILGFALTGLPPPPIVTDVADVSYLSPGPGARTAELYRTDDDKAAAEFERTWGRGRTTVGLADVVILWRNPPSPKNGTVLRFGRTVVFWTTRPSPKQRRAIGACLGG